MRTIAVFIVLIVAQNSHAQFRGPLPPSLKKDEVSKARQTAKTTNDLLTAYKKYRTKVGEIKPDSGSTSLNDGIKSVGVLDVLGQVAVQVAVSAEQMKLAKASATAAASSTDAAKRSEFRTQTVSLLDKACKTILEANRLALLDKVDSKLQDAIKKALASITEAHEARHLPDARSEDLAKLVNAGQESAAKVKEVAQETLIAKFEDALTSVKKTTDGLSTLEKQIADAKDAESSEASFKSDKTKVDRARLEANAASAAQRIAEADEKPRAKAKTDSLTLVAEKAEKKVRTHLRVADSLVVSSKESSSKASAEVEKAKEIERIKAPDSGDYETTLKHIQKAKALLASAEEAIKSIKNEAKAAKDEVSPRLDKDAYKEALKKLVRKTPNIIDGRTRALVHDYLDGKRRLDDTEGGDSLLVRLSADLSHPHEIDRLWLLHPSLTHSSSETKNAFRTLGETGILTEFSTSIGDNRSYAISNLASGVGGRFNAFVSSAVVTAKIDPVIGEKMVADDTMMIDSGTTTLSLQALDEMKMTVPDTLEPARIDTLDDLSASLSRMVLNGGSLSLNLLYPILSGGGSVMNHATSIYASVGIGSSISNVNNAENRVGILGGVFEHLSTYALRKSDTATLDFELIFGGRAGFYWITDPFAGQDDLLGGSAQVTMNARDEGPDTAERKAMLIVEGLQGRRLFPFAQFALGIRQADRISYGVLYNPN